MTLPSVLTDTDRPNSSYREASNAVNLMPSIVEAHPPAGFVNKSIAPLLALSKEKVGWRSLIAPATIVFPSPLTATDVPKVSLLGPKKPVSGVVSLARAAEDDHPVAGLVNTSAAPALNPLSSSSGTPMTTMLPSALTDTDAPNLSPFPGDAAVSLTPIGGESAHHPPDGLVKTYAAPAFR